MKKITFSKEETATISTKLQQYCEQELDHSIGQFDAEFLLDFIGKEIGAYFYNRGIYDAQQLVHQRMESVTDALIELEQVTEFKQT